MKDIVNTYVEQFRADHRKARRMASLLLTLALIVIAGVFWQLHSTGIAMTNETWCGLTEHQHSEDCYEDVLVCGLEESEGHTHSEECYETQTVLVCGLEESEEHIHSESCYESEQVLICGLEESEGHVHSEECYESQLICGLEEHTHTVECMSEETADVESASDWEATLPTLTGVCADGVVAIAESQLGYTESTANFTLADDGETRQGYTRYGAWYGNEYGDWDAMFASFCLYYGGVDTDAFPLSSGVYSWAAELKGLSLYADAAEYTPVPGDLAFFDTDGDSRIDRVGIVSAVSESSLSVIQGDYTTADGDMVCENTYSLTAGSIAGFGVLPTETAANGIMLTAEEETQPVLTATDYTLDGVKALYDALPTEAEIEAMTTSAELYAAYDRLAEAYEAYMTLSFNDRVELSGYISDEFGYSHDIYLKVLFEVFMNKIMTVEGSLDLIDAVNLYKGVGILTTLDYTFTDSSGTVITPSSGSNYTLTIEESYKIEMTLYCELMQEGVYTIVLPDEIEVTDSYEKTLTVSDSYGNVYEVGKYISEAGNQIVRFEINDLYKFNGITVSGYIMSKVVARQDFELFEGATIHVDLPDPEKGTTVDKSGKYDTTKGKLTWTATLTGHEYSSIPGMALTDTITTPDTHYFSQDDMTSGIVFTARYFGNGLYTNPTETYVWTVTDGDPNLTWTKSEWVYTFPTSTFTDDNGAGVTPPVSDATNWVITVVYTSTMIPQASGGVISYSNMASCDLSSDVTTVRPPVEEAYINKVGEYVAGDKTTSDDDYIEWTITAVIPAYSGQGTPVFGWRILDDSLSVVDASGNEVETLTNTFADSSYVEITATIGDTTYQVPYYSNVSSSSTSADTPIVWTTGTDSGIYSARDNVNAIMFYNVDSCTSSSCSFSGYRDAFRKKYEDTYSVKCDNDVIYCMCWERAQDVTLTITYRTDVSDIVEKYGTLNEDYSVYNHAQLMHAIIDTDEIPADWPNKTECETEELVDLPVIISKRMTTASPTYLGYEAKFEVKIDSSIIDFTLLDEITITDTMNKALTFVESSLKITWADDNGNSGVLSTDYYTVTNDARNKMFEIVIDRQVVKATSYVLEYSAIWYPLSGSIDTAIENTAELTIGGKTYSSTRKEVVDMSVFMTGTNRMLYIIKGDADDSSMRLADAEFNLYSADNNTLLTTVTTGTNGQGAVSSSTLIPFQEHELYYVIEVTPPDGYQLNSNKYYFWFCDDGGLDINGIDDCPECQTLADALIQSGVSEEYISNPIKTGQAYIETIYIADNKISYELPNTGGTGVQTYTVTGLAVMGVAAFMLTGRRKRGKRKSS
ncbi:MAG: LPXTG cell wall anchor domain-containing protein [Lachnospiraceae bacterium]|nr:LPXTG cell wall anchor domain-containing protein [Lachnospiraceae bacterium]